MYRPPCSKFKLFLHYGSYAVLATVVVMVSWYSTEDRSDLHDTYQYYGAITTKPIFEYPEPIELITFGWMSTETRETTFINQLWCKPSDTSSAKELVATRVVKLPEWSFNNELPPDLQATARLIETEGYSAGYIGINDRKEIRKIHEVTPFETWLLTETVDSDVAITPEVSSKCHITHTILLYTPFFDIPRTIQYTGHEFTYVMP